MRIGLTYNLKGSDAGPADERNAEWDDPQTIQAIHQALSIEHQVVSILADQNAYEKFKASGAGIVFNVAEGFSGPNRESHIPSMLEFLGIPYTGSDPLTLSLCLDKAKTKELLNYNRIPTPRFCVVENGQDLVWPDLYPAMVKPLWEGSSIGVHNSCWVKNAKELASQVRVIWEQYHQPALVEEGLLGREFTVALMGNGDDLKVLPIVEVNLAALPPEANPIYSYEAKWIWDVPENPLDIFHCPASLTAVLKGKIEETAKRAFKAMGCRDWCRIDIRLDAGETPHVLELNPLPGILPDPDQNSCFPKAARAAGMSYQEMILGVLNIAMKRYGLNKKQNVPVPAER
jgi:D-alanine-D-alanine ligase